MADFASGARLEFFDQIDSTSAEIKRRVEQGETGPLWILAHEQTGGYGRRGRPWQSALGNFAGTFLFAPDGEAQRLGELSYITALGLIEALDRHAAPASGLGLKWPNDVLANGAKICGILLESLPGAHKPLISIGIGVNLTFAPGGLDYPTARLVDLLKSGEKAPGAEQLAREIDTAFHAYYEIWRCDGFAPIREAWLARAIGLGAPITVRLPREEIAGTFDDLDETGALVLGVDGGQRRFTAGEVMFPGR